MGFTEAQLQIIQQAVKAGLSDVMKEIFEQQRGTHDAIVAINQRLEEGDGAMKKLAADLQANSDSTAQMREMFENAKKGFAALGSLGTAAKWLLKVIAPIATVGWIVKQWWTTGHFPTNFPWKP